MELLKCTGFLDAMTLLNSAESDCYAEFYLTQLPQAANLKSALALHYANYLKENDIVLRDGAAGDAWSIDTLEIPAPSTMLDATCRKWFFCSEHMTSTPSGTHRANIISHFLCELKQAVGAATTHRVYITPPCWYAIDWDEIAFEREDRRYLLHFSHSN